MKINPPPRASKTQSTSRPPLAEAKKALSAAATRSVAKAIVAKSAHPLVEKFGEALGLGLGVIVTEALKVVPSWNQPVLDARGKPVRSVEGANRIGEHDILKRHEEVVGPKVSALVE